MLCNVSRKGTAGCYRLRVASSLAVPEREEDGGGAAAVVMLGTGETWVGLGAVGCGCAEDLGFFFFFLELVVGCSGGEVGVALVARPSENTSENTSRVGSAAGRMVVESARESGEMGRRGTWVIDDGVACVMRSNKGVVCARLDLCAFVCVCVCLCLWWGEGTARFPKKGSTARRSRFGASPTRLRWQGCVCATCCVVCPSRVKTFYVKGAGV